MIVNGTIYANGRRKEPFSMERARNVCGERKGFVWLELHEPTREEFDSVIDDFKLPKPAVEDAKKVHQRPRLEHYGSLLFFVVKSARYLEQIEAVGFGEIHIFLGADFVVTVGHGDTPSLEAARRELESEPKLLNKGPAAVLHAVTDQIVDGYEPVVEGLENDIDEIEAEVFGGNPGVSRRIYELYREVTSFRRAAQPLSRLLEYLVEGDLSASDAELKRRLRGVHDRAARISEQIEVFRELLSNILDVNLTLISVEQNDQTKRISAWAAILIVPTIITGVYGMNFRYMPELSEVWGYPFALLLMMVISGVLYLRFKRSSWL